MVIKKCVGYRLASMVFLVILGMIDCRNTAAHEFIIQPTVSKRRNVGRWRRAVAQAIPHAIEASAQTIAGLGRMQTFLCEPVCEYATHGRMPQFIRTASAEQLEEYCKQVRRVRHSMKRLNRDIEELSRVFNELRGGTVLETPIK